MRLPFLFAVALGFASLLPLAAQAQGGVESVLRPGDSIEIKLSGVPQEEIAIVSNSYNISDGGTINLPYIGELRASGMRSSQLQRVIEAAYKNGEIFTHPTILISTGKGESPTQIVYVSGEVKTPNRVVITPGMTIMDAITSAGGPTDFATLRKVKFTRAGTTRELDLRKVDNPDASLQLQPGDRVHVPK